MKELSENNELTREESVLKSTTSPDGNPQDSTGSPGLTSGASTGEGLSLEDSTSLIGSNFISDSIQCALSDFIHYIE